MPERKTEAYWSESQQRWQCKVQLDGVRRTFVSTKANSKPTSKKGKIEAETKADRWLKAGTVGESTRCDALLDRFYADVKSSTSAANYEQVEQQIRLYIRPVIGRKRISKLTAGDLQDVINNTYKERQLAFKTLSSLRSTLMLFTKYCRKHKYTTLYPEDLEIPSGASRPNKKPLNPEALKILFSDPCVRFHRILVEDPLIYAYRFAVVTGLRPGELIGLQQRDIDGSTYTIRRAINTRGEVTQGKNANAQRAAQMSELAMKILSDQRRALAARNIISLYVFPDADGGPLTQQRLRDSWKRYCNTHGITEGATPYELRHTFVSVNTEMPIALKRLIMGHSQNMDTEGVYGHEMEGSRAKAAGYIDAAFGRYIK